MLTLQAGESSLVLAPELGGAIVGWTLGQVPLLRRARANAIMPGDVHGLGSFPLVPYSNRIADGRFQWRGREHQLERNFGDHPHTIHGVGWQTPWSVAAASRSAATLTLRHGAGEAQARRWPFAFEAEQRFTLLPDRLEISLAITNRHFASAPAGLGLHPYFPCPRGTVLRFVATEVWHNGADMLPSRRAAVPPEWDHTDGLAVGSCRLDNCFVGWDGRSRITWQDTGIGLEIEAERAFGHLIVFTPSAHDYFCVEPVTHVTDAVNRPDYPAGSRLRTLASGETLRGMVTFRVTTGGMTTAN